MKRKISENAEGGLKFEQALRRLEEIVEEMEAGEVSLEELLKKYEEGMKLAQFCQAKLNEAQQRIEVLTKGKGNEARLQPFTQREPPAADAEEDEEEGEKDSKLF